MAFAYQYTTPIPKLLTLRFLTLLSHLVILILIFMDRKGNIVSTLQRAYTSEDYIKADNNFVVWLSLSVSFLSVELISFMFTVTTFFPCQSLISILSHTIAIFILFPYYLDSWKYSDIQWIFGFCTVMPCLTEAFTYIIKLSFKKTFV